MPAKFRCLGLWSRHLVVVGFGVLSAYFGKKTLATSAEMLNSDFPEVAKVIVTIVVPGIAGDHLARKNSQTCTFLAIFDNLAVNWPN